MAFGNRSGERETETNDGNGALAGERAGESASGGHAESAGLEHLSGGTGVKSLFSGIFEVGITRDAVKTNRVNSILYKAGQTGCTANEKTEIQYKSHCGLFTGASSTIRIFPLFIVLIFV